MKYPGLTLTEHGWITELATTINFITFFEKNALGSHQADESTK